MSSNSKNTQTIVLSVVAILIAGYGYHYLITNNKKPDGSTDKRPSTAEKVEKIDSLDSKKDTIPAVTAKDVEDDSDEDEEETPIEEAAPEGRSEEDLAAMKDVYVNANRLADKFIKGHSFQKAAEKLSEAIELASDLPCASKDVLTLYNNRSAMYEKLGEYDKSLQDINVVLTMDAYHIKARVRSARVHDAKNQEQKALDDYVYAMFLERIKGDQSSHDKKIETLCQSLGMKRATKVLTDIRTTTTKALPGITYCRNFLENFPSLHHWKSKYGSSDDTDCRRKRAELAAAVEAASSSSSSSADKLTAILDLVCMDLACEEHASAFGVLSKVADMAWSPADDSTAPYALMYELRGTEHHLKCNLDLAIAAYQKALEIDPISVDTKLKLASVFLDLGERDKAEKIYTELSPTNDTMEGNIALSWVFVHSSSLWLTRDATFKYPPQAVQNALVAVDAALSLTATAVESDGGLEESRKAARFVALMKSVHILTQVKAQLGEAPTAEESQRNINSVAEAKKLYPKKLSVLLMEAEQLQMQGQLEESQSILDSAVSIASKSGDKKSVVDVTLLRASGLTSQAFATLQNPASGQFEVQRAQNTFQEVETLYKNALEIDGTAIEVMAQYAQLKSMIMGDFDGAVELLTRALPLARSSDEVQELCQLLVMNEAQAKTVAALQQAST
jgi:tetratricopeptide (TPR) repeat protein